MGHAEQALTQLAMRGIPSLTTLFSGSSFKETDRAVRALADLAINGWKVSAGAILPLIALLLSPRVKVRAAWALANLALNDENRATIASAGGIPPLIALLGGGPDNVKAQAALALGNLARNDDNRATIASAGGIPPLIALLGGSDNVKVHAAGTLAALALNDDNKATITSVGGIPPLTALLSGSGDVRNHAEQVLTQLGLHALCRPRRGRKRMKASHAES